MFFLGANPWGEGFGVGYGVQINKSMLTARLVRYAVARIRMGTDDVDQRDEITANTVGIVHLLVVLAIAGLGGIFAVVMKQRARKSASADPSRRSNVLPSTIILVGLSFAGLGTLDGSEPSVLPPYFPEVDDHPDRIGSDLRVEWYSRQLRAADQPSLWLLSRQDQKATVFRFLWLPSFDHPICVRIDRRENGAILKVIVLDGYGGYDPGQVAIDRTVELDKSQWAGLELDLEAAAFWSIPTSDPEEESGSDGDHCIIEGVKDGRYHVVDRYDPNPAFTALCRSMLDLTGLKTRKSWKKYHPDEPIP